MLYLLPGISKCGLNAGGLQHCIEEVERLAILESDPMIQYTKEGVFALPRGSRVGERLGAVEYRISPMLEREGIGWEWFPENWGFGNSTTVHKTSANRETMLIDHRTGNDVQDLIASGHPLDLGNLIIQQIPKRTEGWVQYESRWAPETCPQESHDVLLTWLVTRGEMESWAYERLLRIIEDPSAVLRDVERYNTDHFSPTRQKTVKRSKLEIPGVTNAVSLHS